MLREPLRLRPLFRQYLWGGRRLGEVLGKPIGAGENYAESWEVVDHGEDQSVVEQGPLAGHTLRRLVRQHPGDLLGRHAGCDSFPLLLKYLDCHHVLSVQVHPDDEYAARMDPPDRGKTEAWYVVEAQPESVIYAGLRAGVGRAELAEAVAAGQVASVLHTISARPGQCIFIPAGTVHALGAGLLVAEIQQSSDTTFRLFDWDRVDDQGRGRPLHVDQALAVTDYDRGPVAPQPSRPVQESAAGSLEELVACDQFVLQRARGTQILSLPGDRRCRIATVVQGEANCHWPGGTMRLARGATALIPAAAQQVVLAPEEGGGATILLVSLP